MIAVGAIVFGYVMLVATTGWLGVAVVAVHIVVMLCAAAAEGWLRR